MADRVIVNLKNKISKLKLELLTKSYYKKLEKAPIHLLQNYWSSQKEIFNNIQKN